MPAQAYEHPLPVLELDTANLTIDSNNNPATFTIKNAGGGNLTGHILSRQNGLSFSPSQWTGNSQSISCTYSLATDKPLTTQTQAYICTNGGEISLPITINHAPMTLQTEEGQNLTSIGDFYNYSLSYPQAARRLFTSSEFYMLLLSTGYEYMEVYESLHKDPNRERAMDNFFILSGLKTKTQLTLETNHLNIIQKPTESSFHTIQIQSSDNGYADSPITTGGAPWLTLDTTRLISNSFNNNKATLGFTIDPAQMPNAFASEQIQIGPEPSNTLTLSVRKAPPFTLRLSRTGYRYEDRGTIEVENNTGMNMTVEVYSRERYVRFYTSAYTIGPAHSIPFEIRPQAFASAQRIFRRLPYISTYVDLRAHCPGQVFQKRLFLTIGEW